MLENRMAEEKSPPPPFFRRRKPRETMPLNAPRDLYEDPAASGATAAPAGRAKATPEFQPLISAWQLPASRSYRLAAATAVLAASDLVVASLCATVAQLLAVGHLGGLAATVLLFGLCTVAGMQLAGVHNPKESRKTNELALRVLFGVAASFVATMTVSLAWPGAPVGRTVIAAYYLLALPLLMAWHLLGSGRTRSRFKPDSIAVVGPQETAAEVARSISDNDAFRLGLVMTPSPSGAVLLSDGKAAPTVVAVEDIPSIIAREGVGSIAVADSTTKHSVELYRQLWNCRNMGIDVLDIGDCLEMLDKKLALDRLDAWHTPSLSFPGWDRALDDKLKRFCDIVMAVTGMILSAPVMLAAAVAIRWSDGGPVIFSQERVGLRGRTYRMYKFRSMAVDAGDAEPDSRARWSFVTLLDDPRAFPAGRILRNTHMDELPQLWNVLKGDMSMIGPRPERPELVAELRQKIPHYDARHATRPGISGWTQLQWPRCKYTGCMVEDTRAKLEYELYYVRYRNVLWDVHIAAKTVLFVLEAFRPHRKA